MRNKRNWSGFVIARLLDNNKPYTFYPSKEHGRPPFLFKKKKTALRKLSSQSMHDYKFSNDLKVVKYKKEMYLDRY